MLFSKPHRTANMILALGLSLSSYSTWNETGSPSRNSNLQQSMATELLILLGSCFESQGYLPSLVYVHFRNIIHFPGLCQASYAACRGLARGQSQTCAEICPSHMTQQSSKCQPWPKPVLVVDCSGLRTNDEAKTTIWVPATHDSRKSPGEIMHFTGVLRPKIDAAPVPDGSFKLFWGGLEAQREVDDS